MRIGYSCWGFLGAGVTDTPDGGRSHRRTLIDGLVARGHDVTFLQANRDLLEAGDDFTSLYQWDGGLPAVDVLFLEWRWPIKGRNTTLCGTVGHTCDLHRQEQLLDHYTRAGVTTLVWDKDLQLPLDHSIRTLTNVVVCEPALHPRVSAPALQFPVDDATLDAADPASLAAFNRDLALSYVGNQYDRDDVFDTFFAPVAASVPHVVAGKWPRTSRWPHVNFIGRVPFTQVEAIYERSLATITLLPDRYAQAGQMTQRLFEAVFAGCLPLVPTSIRSHHRFAPPQLQVSNGADALAVLHKLSQVAGSDEHVALLGRCLDALDQFRLSRQLAAIEEALSLATAIPSTSERAVVR